MIAPITRFNPAIGGVANAALLWIEVDRPESPALYRDAFLAAMPAEHLEFLTDCELCRRIGDYVFVHAGIRPEVRLDAQSRDGPHLDPRSVPDLDTGLRLQGRARAHDCRPRAAPSQPDRHRHRAARGGPLSCVVLEGIGGVAADPSGRSRRRSALASASTGSAATCAAGWRALGRRRRIRHDDPRGPCIAARGGVSQPRMPAEGV